MQPQPDRNDFAKHRLGSASALSVVGILYTMPRQPETGGRATGAGHCLSPHLQVRHSGLFATRSIP